MNFITIILINFQEHYILEPSDFFKDTFQNLAGKTAELDEYKVKFGAYSRF